MSQREDERTHKLREGFLSNYKHTVSRVDNLEQKASYLSETKLDTIEYIKKNIVDEYPKVIRKDFDSINSVAIIQIQDVLDRGLFKNKEDLLFFNSANYIVSKYREYELFQLKLWG